VYLTLTKLQDTSLYRYIKYKQSDASAKIYTAIKPLILAPVAEYNSLSSMNEWAYVVVAS